MSAGLNDLLSKLQSIKISGTDSVTNLGELTDAVGSAVSFLAADYRLAFLPDNQEPLASYLKKTFDSGASLVAWSVRQGLDDHFAYPSGYWGAISGVASVTLPAAGNAIYSNVLDIRKYKSHFLSLSWEGGATPPTVGQLTIIANLYDSVYGYVGSLNLCQTNVLPWNGATFVFGFRPGYYGGGGYGFAADAQALALLAIPRVEFKFYVNTTYDNGPWKVSLYYFGSS